MLGLRLTRSLVQMNDQLDTILLVRDPFNESTVRKIIDTSNISDLDTVTIGGHAWGQPTILL